ncbi:MAG: hypothetical protein ACM3PT_12300 [Deltaproteobacteria bacterium]
MKTKSFISGTLAGTIVYFLLGYLVYQVLFKSIYPENEQFSHSILFVFLGCLFFGALVAWIFVRWANITNWMTGARAGALIGFFYNASMNFFMYSGQEVNYRNLFLDIVLNIIMGAVVGAVTAFVAGKFSK